MSDGNVVELRSPASEARDALTEVLREGAQRLLAQAVEAEVAAFVAEHLHLRDEAGRRVVVRRSPVVRMPVSNRHPAPARPVRRHRRS